MALLMKSGCSAIHLAPLAQYFGNVNCHLPLRQQGLGDVLTQAGFASTFCTQQRNSNDPIAHGDAKLEGQCN